MTLGMSHIRELKNGGCRHRDRSTGTNDPAGEHEESSSGPTEFEVMVDVNEVGFPPKLVF